MLLDSMLNLSNQKALFITGTGTDIGKTFVTGLLLKKLVASGFYATYYKAALSGAEYMDNQLIAGDSKYVLDTAGITDIDPNDHVSYIFETAVSPHLASRIENNPIKMDKIKNDFKKIINTYEYTLVEGSGGIVCPLSLDNEKVMLIDVILELKLDVIIVASAALGTINSVTLTVEYAKNHGIHVQGIILNGYDKDNFMHVDNKKSIEWMTGVTVLACVANDDEEIDIDIRILKNCFTSL